MTTPTGDVAERIAAISDDLVARLDPMTFSPPITHVYNPLVYAREGYDRYVRRFGSCPKPMVWVGMNPGPFGMVQTGVPFGDVEMVRDWMGIAARVHPPANGHPQRPVTGFDCPRREVSGQRLWGWAKGRYESPDAFFNRVFVLNYCPLVFMEASGRNRTPDRLAAEEKRRLFAVCDKALRRSIAVYRPAWVIGIGDFAEKRIHQALNGMDMKIGRITHPSPANPKANRGWGRRVESELAAMGIDL